MSLEHWTPAKKRLECQPEPTSLPARNRPEDIVPCCLERPEPRLLTVLKRVAPRGWQHRPRGSRNSESRIGRQARSLHSERAHSDRAHSDREVQTERFYRLGAQK